MTGGGTCDAKTGSDCIARVLEREPDWDALPVETPAGVRRLLRRCLEKDRRQRLHDVADARIELEDLLAGKEKESDTMPAASRSRSRAAIGLVGAEIGRAHV